MKAYREYAVSKKSLELLTEEDRFIYRLSFTERLASKLNVMHYIGNYFDNIHLITPVNNIILFTEELFTQKKLTKKSQKFNFFFFFNLKKF